ncbi:angiogenic factor with G patch and FHA domains 1 [Chanos chanos]|uniref:Angiogenic factor with G patch and FHA domains 1 n=1 Tax=Chanos chanos TaxID=29144 RepID=A0A6J2UYA3_CHACN|nr:angiogenic factor with G patch and FHA domains 1 [Chanos chanos]
MTTNGEDGCEVELLDLRSQVETLKEELKMCKNELQKLQKQLSQSERLQKTAESYNEDLRQQVDRLSKEIHERKRKEKDKTDAETQTDEYTWTETDYYNYYYGSYDQTGTETTGTEEAPVATETQETSSSTEPYSMAETTTVSTEQQEENNSAPQAESGSGDGSSIADMLRATAEAALNQTGFVFDENSGLYYDHTSGFYYDSSSQLYYDANTGMYYYYDTESGKYQFHSRVELPAAQPATEPSEETKNQNRKSKKWSKKNSGKGSRQDVGDHGEKLLEEEHLEFDGRWVEHRRGRRNGLSSQNEKRRSSSPERPSRSERSRKKRRSRSAEPSAKMKKSKRKRGSRSRSDDRSRRKRKEKRERERSKLGSRRGRRRKTRSDDAISASEPEEGEITDSEGGRESSPSSSSSSSSSSAAAAAAPPISPSPHSPESEMETQTQEVAEEAWPPCVRVTVIRSPVLQTGTLFILTADSTATIGREKDMNHAIRIPEVGVSKSHAEVYFDQEQQCYMLVDQGSQNGTVINGTRILQPKSRCDPCPLSHGDEVKMGETVLSFHIHTGNDTCDGCEPGQVIAHLSKHRREDGTGTILSREDKETQRLRELKQMKVKYGLKNSEYEENTTLKNSKYKDRAETRRQVMGSEGNFQRDDAPASVHVEINEANKGRKMLEKMGWKKGEGLGKDGAGMKDPIQVQIHKAQSGLGSSATVSVEDGSLTRTRTQKNWEKARERFADTYETAAHTDKGRSPKHWIKGQDPE